MDQAQKYKNHIEKQEDVIKAAWSLEHKSLSFRTDVEPLRKDFLHLKSLGEEVVAAVKILIETDEQIVNSQIRADELGAVGDDFGKLKEQGSASTTDAWTRMSLSWKTLLYSVRCFQDCIYRAILHAQFEQAGPWSSMSKCIHGDAWRDDSAVGKLIAVHLPTYPIWFIRTRKLRNELKKGLNVTSVWRGREPEHFIVLCEQRWNGNMIENTAEYPLRLEFATESLEMCVAVAALIPIAFDEAQARKQARSQRTALSGFSQN
jgi:hypothetical protein